MLKSSYPALYDLETKTLHSLIGMPSFVMGAVGLFQSNVGGFQGYGWLMAV